MKIGIISDTHDKVLGVDQAMRIFSEQAVGLIVHCGDWAKPETAQYFAAMAAAARIPVKGVLGNNDREIDAFLDISHKHSGFALQEGVLKFTVDGRIVSAYHGHHKPTLKNLLTEPIDLLCLGHSHKPRYDVLDDRIIINPGSTAFAIPRSRTWHASVAVYDTKKHEAEFIYF